MRKKAEIRVHSRKRKSCEVCQKTIPWRRWLERNWDQLQYCSAVCRRTANDLARVAASPAQKLNREPLADAAAA